MKSPTHLQTEQQPRSANGPTGQPDQMAEDADEFDDEPTVSNLRNPAAAPASSDSDDDPARTPTGSYRMVRPATSDRLNCSDPPPPVTAKAAKKRAIIGVTRRR